MKGRPEHKNITKVKILEYILQVTETSKMELSKELELSTPTVLSTVNSMIDMGLIVEIGEYKSTGGRKAKSLGINKRFRFAVGVNITSNHIGMVLLNLGGEIEKFERKRLKFSTDMEYFKQFAKEVERFIAGFDKPEHILGIGIALPGIIDKGKKILLKSHALLLENYSLGMLEQVMPLPVFFENDANAAMMAENLHKDQNLIYLSLNNTVGGAIYMNGKLFEGHCHKAGEFGHMILVPNGRKCYCGKAGCADAYCATGRLTDLTAGSLDAFKELLDGGSPEALQIWEEYLEHLAVLISNLRMAYDTDIILGGDVGGILKEYMLSLGEKIFKYNLFDNDLVYLKNCKYQKEAAAVGAAHYFLDEFVHNI